MHQSHKGTIESTGQSIQARTSYLPSEILWGERFVPVLQSDNEDAEFLVNFSFFNMTKKQKMPNFSSREYQIRKKFHKLIQFKKILSKLSEMESNDDETNLLRHLINQNDHKHNLSGLITNMDELNNLNNLLNTINKLVNNNGANGNTAVATSINAGNGNSPFNSKNHLNLGNQTTTNNCNLPSINQFYQQSLSVDQAMMNRKKSTDLSQLLDLLQNSQNFYNIKSDHKSKSINNLNLINGTGLNHSSMNNQNGFYDKSSFKRNDSEHITIEDDQLVSESSETANHKKPSTLKLLSLFQPTINSSDHRWRSDHHGFNNSNYDANFNSIPNQTSVINQSSNQLNITKKIKEKDPKFFLSASPKSMGKSENFLNENSDLDVNFNWKSKSDWNISRKRQFFKSKK